MSAESQLVFASAGADAVASPRLSVCIPTFDRAGFIGLAIDSVLAQSAGLPVEIVVCDNASNDGTEALVRAMMASHPQLRYERNGVNLGADQNVLRAASHARGDYFWILGSDDAITPGALAAVLRAVGDDAPSVVMGDAVDCDIQLRPAGMLTFFSSGARDFDFAAPADVAAFLTSATMTASLFGYLSSMVFQRSLWLRLPLKRYTVGTAYPQVFRALDMVCEGPGRLRYLAEPIAYDRRDNCSYASEFGVVTRNLADLRMFRLAIDAYFSDSLVRRHGFKRLIRRCSGPLFSKPTRVGIPAIDELIEFFEVDDTALRVIAAWPCSPEVDAARERLQSHDAGRRLLGADALLHIGYRRHARPEHRPINARAIGVDDGFSGFDGARLPFESASQQAVFIGHSGAFRSPWPDALRECARVLHPGGWLGWCADAGSPAALVGQAQQALGADFRLRHAAQNDDGSVDIVLQRSAAADSAVAWRICLADADLAQRQGDWPRAAELARQVLAAEPNEATALQLLGAAALHAGRAADAVAAFSAALCRRTDSAPGWCNLGCAYASLGGYDDAAACFVEALRREPAFGAARSNQQAIAAMPAAARHAARIGFRLAVADDPAVVRVRSWLGTLERIA